MMGRQVLDDMQHSADEPEGDAEPEAKSDGTRGKVGMMMERMLLSMADKLQLDVSGRP